MSREEIDMSHRTPKQLAADRENRQIAEKIEQGTAYHESMTVLFTDRKEHTIEVYAVSSGEFYEAVHGAEIKSKGGEINFAENVTLVEKLVPIATRDLGIMKKLMLNEDGKIMSKIMEISRPPKN
jgi:prolyl-tRNA synthetase